MVKRWTGPIPSTPLLRPSMRCRPGERPALLVLRDDGHGGGKFCDGFDVSDRSPTFMPKSEIPSLDPKLAAVTDLPTGWQACRAAIGAEWVREAFTQE